LLFVLSLFHIIVRSHFGSITCRLVLPPSAMSEYTVAVQNDDVWGVEAEWAFSNPPDDLVPLWKYYEWKTWGWHCRQCNMTASRSHTSGKKHTNMVWREHQEQGAVQAGFPAARFGGGEGSCAAAAAAADNEAAGSSGCGSGGGGGATRPAIAAVGTQQQLDRMEAAIAKLGTELEKISVQHAMLEIKTDHWQ
jgi:hypothetical protein